MRINEMLIDYLMRFVGLPYMWNGNGILGFDCSGLACEGLKAFGVINCDMTAQQLAYKFKDGKVTVPDAGYLVCYGQSFDCITHIGIAINESLMIEAGGAGSACKTKEHAEKLGAMVRIRPIAGRKDLVAVVNPFHDK